MKTTITKTLLASAVAVVCAFSANVASAQTSIFADFTVDPIGPAANFVADKMIGNYVEIANFNLDGTFTANLVWTAAAFQTLDGNYQYTALESGLGYDYGIYALYSAAGQYAMDTDGVTNFTFAPGSGTLSLWLDPNANTKYTAGTTGSNFTSIGTVGDILIGTGNPQSGNGFLDPNNSQCSSGSVNSGIFCGAFGSTTTFELTDAGAKFFVEPSPFYQLSFQSGQLNNFTPSGRVVINGSLDVAFNDVPEPGSLALLGLGLAGLGLSLRRKQA